MKILIVTTDEPFYLPLTFQRLFEKITEDSIRVVILPPTAKKRTWGTIIDEQLRLGTLYFGIRGLQYLFYKILSKNGLRFRGRYYGIEAVCRAYGISCVKFSNINSQEAIAAIRAESPDIITSLSASQLFKREVINLSKYATINIHNSPLPKYQGLMPSFWLLYHGEKETATTVHFMDVGIDTGKIIVQRKVRIEDGETLDSLINKTKLRTVDALLETLALFERYGSNLTTMENKKEEATYFGFPSKKDVREFKQRGRKLLWKNIY